MEEKPNDDQLCVLLQQGQLTTEQIITLTNQTEFPNARSLAARIIENHLSQATQQSGPVRRQMTIAEYQQTVAKEFLEHSSELKTETKKTNERLKPIRENTKKDKKKLEDLCLNSPDKFTPVGNKYMVQKKSKKEAELNIETAKIIYTQFRAELQGGNEPDPIEVEAFGSELEKAQTTLCGETTKFVFSATKPITVLLKKRVVKPHPLSIPILS
jgi:hypothetical protein